MQILIGVRFVVVPQARTEEPVRGQILVACDEADVCPVDTAVGNRSVCLDKTQAGFVRENDHRSKDTELRISVLSDSVFVAANGLEPVKRHQVAEAAAGQGQRELSVFACKELHQVVDTPSRHATLHRKAFLA